MSVNRRNFLRGAAGALATAGTLGVSRPALAEGKGGGGDPDPATISVPFLGANQAGIYRPDFVQKASCFAAFRLLVSDRAGLQALLQTLTTHIQSLSEGSLVASTPPRESEIGGLDSGVLGAQVPPDALTVTVGLGASIFTDTYGLAGVRPRGLRTMPVFPIDTPDPDWTGGDLVLQICSNASDSVHHALRDLTRATRGMMQLEWKILGFHSGPRPTGAPRNLFGYKDGIVNPARGRGPGLDRPGLRSAGLGGRRHLHGGPADPDAGRVLGPGRHLRSRTRSSAGIATRARRWTAPARPTCRTTRPTRTVR